MHIEDDQVYILVNTVLGKALVAHTTEQGATEEMAAYPPGLQKALEVFPVRLVKD
jgi:hypothetical protein